MEVLIAKHNPNRPLIEKVLEWVREFIIQNNGILYGGQAIDFILRKYGSRLYSDDELPDYDFYVPNNVDLAYQLANILREKNIEVDVIRAIHPQTMRVRVAWYFVADITYLPATLNLPTIEYKGMKIMHSDILLMGQHLSLSFPYYGPPKEAIFHRFFKDLERFNLLYDLPTSKHIRNFNTDNYLPLLYKEEKTKINGVIHGLPAYSLYLKEFKKICKKHKISISDLSLPTWPTTITTTS